MKITFIDVETTGKADFQSDPEADHQPRIVQIAMILCDHSREEAASVNLIIKQRVDIPAESTAIHGITNERAAEFGIMAFHALYTVQNLIRQADLVVAHNHELDWFVLRGEFARESTDLPMKEAFCTMKAMTPVCKIPGRYDDYKWPKLQEAYKHAFGKEFDGAHDALADVRACKEIFYWLKDRPPEPPKP